MAIATAGCDQPSPEKLIGSAKDSLVKGDNQAAIIHLKNVLRDAPENAEARFLLGKASLEARDFPAAEKELRRSLELNQPADAVLPLLAQAMTQLGQHEQLVKDFGERRLEEPNAQAIFQTLLGDAILRGNDPVGARRAYAAALAAQPDYPPAKLGQISLIAAEGKIDEALAEVDRLLVISPKLAAAHNFRGDLLISKGDLPGARGAFEAAIGADGNFMAPRLALIGVLIDERRFEDAAKLLESSRRLAARDLRLSYLDARLAFRMGNREKARQQVEQVLKHLPDHLPSLLLLGQINLLDGRYLAAESSLRKVISLVPGDRGARQLLVRTYLRMGQPARAREALQPMLVKGTSLNASLLMLAGETFLANGDVKTASAFYTAAAKVAPAQGAAARSRLGQIALAAGRTEEGFAELEAASELDSQQYQADLSIIAGRLARTDTVRAMSAAKVLEKKQPNNPLTFQIQGFIQLRAGDAASARRSFEKALELQPGYLPAAQQLSFLDLADKRPDAARKRFEALIAKDSKNDQLYLALADFEVRAGTDAKTIGEILKRAVAANPQSMAAQQALISLHLKNNDAAGALSAAQAALAALPNDPGILDVAGTAQEIAGDFNQATETYNRWASLQPKSPAPLVRLAALYTRQKNPERAIDALRRARKVAPDTVELIPQLASLYVAAKRPEEALVEARELQKAAPRSPLGFALEGDILASQKRFPQAERAYQEAVKVDPRSAVVAIGLHRTMVDAGKAKEAEAFAKKWIADNPKSPDIRMYLGDRAMSAGENKAAAAHFAAAVELDPNNPMALINLAWVGREASGSKSLEYAERAFKAAPQNAAVLYTYGSLLLENGETSRGLDYLSRAASLSPRGFEVRMDYARALAKAGQREAARKELESLLAQPEDFPGKGEIPSLLKTL